MGLMQALGIVLLSLTPAGSKSRPLLLDAPANTTASAPWAPAVGGLWGRLLGSIRQARGRVFRLFFGKIHPLDSWGENSPRAKSSETM